MRKWISIMLAIMLALSSSALAESDANALNSDIGNKLGLNILHRLYLYDQQALFSPTSLTFALAMAAEGAHGETRDQLIAALGVDSLSLDSLRVTMDSLAVRGVKLANAAFISTKVEPKKAYIDNLANALDTEIFRYDHMHDVLFDINEWARKKTDGMIEMILDGKPDPNLVMVLINALALDAKWRLPFDADSTHTDTFHSVARDIDAQFMSATRYMQYLDAETFQAVYMPYEADALGMYVILPDEGRMYDTLEAFSVNGMTLLGGMESKRVAFAMPKVKLDASMELVEMLHTLGMTKPFDQDADFTGILENTALWIGAITQSVYLEVNENGTRAAAATAIAMATSAMQVEEPIELTVNRPYIMLVYDEETNSILFAAAISDPTV